MLEHSRVVEWSLATTWHPPGQPMQPSPQHFPPTQAVHTQPQQFPPQLQQQQFPPNAAVPQPAKRVDPEDFNCIRVYRFLAFGQPHDIGISHTKSVWQVASDGVCRAELPHTSKNPLKAEHEGLRFDVPIEGGRSLPAVAHFDWKGGLMCKEWKYEVKVNGVRLQECWTRDKETIPGVPMVEVADPTMGMFQQQIPMQARGPSSESAGLLPPLAMQGPPSSPFGGGQPQQQIPMQAPGLFGQQGFPLSQGPMQTLGVPPHAMGLPQRW